MWCGFFKVSECKWSCCGDFAQKSCYISKGNTSQSLGKKVMQLPPCSGLGWMWTCCDTNVAKCDSLWSYSDYWAGGWWRTACCWLHIPARCQSHQAPHRGTDVEAQCFSWPKAWPLLTSRPQHLLGDRGQFWHWILQRAGSAHQSVFIKQHHW